MSARRVWKPVDKRTVVDHDDADFKTRVSDIVMKYGEVAISHPRDRAVARKVQQSIQHIVYAAGYSKNWETTVMDDPTTCLADPKEFM